MNILKILTIFVSFLFFVSCSSVQSAKEVDVTGDTRADNDILMDVSKLQNSKDYHLQSGDLLEITVFMESDMNKIVRINTNGTITYPLIGNVKISDLCICDAEVVLKNKLKKYIKNPQVSILVKEYTNNTVYVLGQVKKPSSLQIPPEKTLTVLEAITSAGGFTDIANISKVKILRIENGKQKSIDVDVSQITKQGKKSLDISLVAGDIIFVPQSMF